MDDDSELEELRKQKLAAKQKEAQEKEIESKLKDALRSALTDAAYDRLSNVAIANKELYLDCAQQVLLSAKRVGRQINEKELLMILKALKARSEKDVSIRFQRK